MTALSKGRVRAAWRAALEFAQGLTGYRSFEVIDMVANTLGVLIGWTIAPPRGPDLLSRLEGRQ